MSSETQTPLLTDFPAYEKQAIKVESTGTLLAWFPLLLILAVAIAIRLPMLTQVGYRWDLYSFEDWIRRADKNGFLALYAQPAPDEGIETDHPPLGVALLDLSSRLYLDSAGQVNSVPPNHAVDSTPQYVRALKLPPFIFDLLLVCIGYGIALREANWRWAIAVGCALALNPALFIDSAWWGQTDVIFTTFMVMTIYALHRRWITVTWVLYAIAILAKFQAIALLPLILVLGYRRTNLKRMAIGALIFAALILIPLLPFMAVSGVSETLRPYLEASGKYPFITVKADNFWLWSLASTRNMESSWDKMPPDSQVTWGDGIYWGPISGRIVGMALFGLCALVIVARGWQNPDQGNDYLLAAGLYVAFFTFAPEMQVRYLYPAIPLITLAGIKRPSIWLLWLGLSVVCLFNILAETLYTRNPFWNFIYLAMPWHSYQVARLEVVLCVALMVFILAHRKDAPAYPNSAQSSAG
ncbi:MAG TPA: hypothetical protein VKQ72_21075 [Aggregatilineales bacterium]|nr:hypothetical protein [Aggregatilineales bacterium]